MDENIKDITPLNVQNGSKEAIFIRLKTERLLSVIYLITDSISDMDPVKWRLRELSLEIYSNANDLYSQKDKVESIRLKGRLSSVNLIRKIDQIISLLGVVINSGAVSQMNFSLIQKEYINLKNVLGNMFQTPDWDKYMLSEELKELSKGQNDIGQTKKYMSYKKIDLTDRYKTKNNSKKDSYSKTKLDREDKIISYLKGGKWASIKDISANIPGCSDKTVQRELNNLVAKNVLKKKGERRWSRYALL